MLSFCGAAMAKFCPVHDTLGKAGLGDSDFEQQCSAKQSIALQRPKADQIGTLEPQELVDSVQGAVHSVQKRMAHYDGSLLQVSSCLLLACCLPACQCQT